VKTVKIEMDKPEDSMVEYEEKPRYPYGTKLSFDEDLIEKMGIKELEVGDEVVVYGVAKVCAKSEHSSEDESGEETDAEVSIQMIEIGIGSEPNGKDTTAIMYKDD